MSTDNGDDNTQNNREAEENSQNTNIDLTSFASIKYNEGRKKVEKDVLNKFEQKTGKSVEKIEDVFDWIETSSNKLAESISDPTQTNEYKELQSTANKYKRQKEEAEQAAQSIRDQYKIDSTFSEATSKLKEASKFKIPESDVKDLFLAKHKVEFKDGKEIVKQGGTPLMDDSGNYKPLQKAFIDFSKNYTEPATDGAGGGSGDGGGGKPKFADFKKASQVGNREQQAKLINQAKSAGGWEEPDAPKVD